MSAAIAYIQLREEWKRCNKEENKDENTMKMAEEIKGAIFVSFWQMNVADIEMTVSHVCKAVSLQNRIGSSYVLTFRYLYSSKLMSNCFT